MAPPLSMKLTNIIGILILPLLSTGADDIESLQPFFEQYCVDCHGAEKQKGDVRFDDLSTFDFGLWEDVYEQLASEEMPPDDEPQPTDAERRGLLKYVLNLAQEGAPADTTGYRRLNKREYSNTVRDLLGLRKGTFDPGEYIYDDEIDEGFDTEAESLVISNELLLEYLGAAEKSLRHALFSNSAGKPATRVVDVKMQRMKGGSSRYINALPDHFILRVGGEAKIYDGEETRSMTDPGRYKITVTASGIDRDRYPIKFIPEEGPLILGLGIVPNEQENLSGKGIVQQTFELKDQVEQAFELDLWIDKGHFPYLSFVNGSTKPITQIRSNIRRRNLPESAMAEPFVGPGIRISQFRIEGPFHDEWPPESFRTTYDAEEVPDIANQGARRELVHRFATRAFRRPVTKTEIAPYLKYLDQQHAATDDWHESLIRTFAAMMASLDFLYLHEGKGELDAFALANRLSYFLWSTMPDAELLALASSGQIKEASVLSAQVDRLLADPRSERFCDSFADQWLALDTLGSMPPDTKNPQFKAYHRNKLEPAMLEETRRFFRHVLEDDRSVRDFIDSNYSFINRGLAELYDVPFEGGDDLIRVTFPADVKRGGLLGHGSILTLTSNGVETSPVVRGHWVLDELLGTPPPPAPKEVPALVPDLNGVDTVRDQLERHRSDPSCIECHRQMDPLGMALEAYDPIGRLRTEYSETQALTTYGNYKGTDFTDIEELKKIMLTDLQPFARNITIRVAEYAKGRKLQPADFFIVEDIVEKSAENDFKLNDLIRRIAISELMTHR